MEWCDPRRHAQLFIDKCVVRPRWHLPFRRNRRARDEICRGAGTWGRVRNWYRGRSQQLKIAQHAEAGHHFGDAVGSLVEVTRLTSAITGAHNHRGNQRSSERWRLLSRCDAHETFIHHRADFPHSIYGIRCSGKSAVTRDFSHCAIQDSPAFFDRAKTNSMTARR